MNSYMFFSTFFFAFASINSQTIYDVTKFGADPKGVHKSTDAIKKAIEEANSKGGGTVFFPDGEYLTGPINLKSDVTLHLADKTVIKFSKDHADYPPLKVKLAEGMHEESISQLIYAYGQTNIAIIGKGVVDGQGSWWWEKFNQDKNFVRPTFIHFYECKGITIEDITIKNSPMMNVNPIHSEDIKIIGIKIENPVPSPNTDGINVYSCKNVVISKVSISTGDDCIALNAGELHGEKRPSMNIHISDSHMIKGHGGVSIGSPTHGGLKNITVTNCIMESGVIKGLYIKTNRERGGLVEDIHYSEVTLNDVKTQGICLNMIYVGKGQDAAISDSKHITKEPVTATTPHFRNIVYKDIKGTANWPVFLIGLPESPIENITLTNVAIKAPNGNDFVNTKDIIIDGKKQ